MAAATPWEELLGSKNWDTLLDPLDQSLRQLILRCGDFCQATYDAFVNDQNSTSDHNLHFWSRWIEVH